MRHDGERVAVDEVSELPRKPHWIHQVRIGVFWGHGAHDMKGKKTSYSAAHKNLGTRLKDRKDFDTGVQWPGPISEGMISGTKNRRAKKRPIL